MVVFLPRYYARVIHTEETIHIDKSIVRSKRNRFIFAVVS